MDGGVTMSPRHEELYQRVAALGRVRTTVWEGNYSSPKGKKSDLKYLFIFMGLRILPAYTWEHCVGAWCPRKPERGVGFFELELWTVIRCCEVLAVEPTSPSRAVSALKGWAILDTE